MGHFYGETGQKSLVGAKDKTRRQDRFERTTNIPRRIVFGRNRIVVLVGDLIVLVVVGRLGSVAIEILVLLFLLLSLFDS